jgi:peptidoglycan/LPS O-acetylase OafA/YrhL
LALIVFFSHLSALTNDPRFWLFEIYANANFAVKGFFAISGYLVTKSYLNSHGVIDFFQKRIRRIYPAYIGAIVLCLFIGLCISALNSFEFLTSFHTLKYVIANLIFLNFLQPTLPGVFEGNHIQAMDGSLWTIKVEAMLYLCVPLIVILFNKFSRWLVFAAIFFLSLVWVYYFNHISELIIKEEIARQFPGQLSYFTCGALIAFKPKLQNKLQFIALISGAAFLFADHELFRMALEPIFYSATVLFMCQVVVRNCNFGKYGDISYGLYLYHFPIIQVLIQIQLFEFNLFLGAFVSLLLTLLLSLFSWHSLEKPFLNN